MKNLTEPLLKDSKTSDMDDGYAQERDFIGVPDDGGTGLIGLLQKRGGELDKQYAAAKKAQNEAEKERLDEEILRNQEALIEAVNHSNTLNPGQSFEVDGGRAQSGRKVLEDVAAKNSKNSLSKVFGGFWQKFKTAITNLFNNKKDFDPSKALDDLTETRTASPEEVKIELRGPVKGADVAVQVVQTLPERSAPMQQQATTPIPKPVTPAAATQSPIPAPVVPATPEKLGLAKANQEASLTTEANKITRNALRGAIDALASEEAARAAKVSQEKLAAETARVAQNTQEVIPAPVPTQAQSVPGAPPLPPQAPPMPSVPVAPPLPSAQSAMSTAPSIPTAPPIAPQVPSPSNPMSLGPKAATEPDIEVQAPMSLGGASKDPRAALFASIMQGATLRKATQNKTPEPTDNKTPRKPAGVPDEMAAKLARRAELEKERERLAAENKKTQTTTPQTPVKPSTPEDPTKARQMHVSRINTEWDGVVKNEKLKQLFESVGALNKFDTRSDEGQVQEAMRKVHSLHESIVKNLGVMQERLEKIAVLDNENPGKFKPLTTDSLTNSLRTNHSDIAREVKPDDKHKEIIELVAKKVDSSLVEAQEKIVKLEAEKVAEAAKAAEAVKAAAAAKVVAAEAARAAAASTPSAEQGNAQSGPPPAPPVPNAPPLAPPVPNAPAIPPAPPPPAPPVPTAPSVPRAPLMPQPALHATPKPAIPTTQKVAAQPNVSVVDQLKARGAGGLNPAPKPKKPQDVTTQAAPFGQNLLKKAAGPIQMLRGANPEVDTPPTNISGPTSGPPRQGVNAPSPTKRNR